MVVNSALSAFVHSQDGHANDSLEMPAHSFALDCYWWLNLTRRPLPRLKMTDFVHGATAWAGLLRIIAGRVTVAGVDTTFVTPEFVRANLERLLQTIQADLNLVVDVIAGGLLTLVSQSLESVPPCLASRFLSPRWRETLPATGSRSVVRATLGTPSAGGSILTMWTGGLR